MSTQTASFIRSTVTLFCLAAVFVLCSGCGGIIEKDRIKIAKLDDKYITRGDISDLIYNMDDTDRPKIRNRNDLKRVLEQYIDDKIKRPLGKKMAEEGTVNVPREMARERFFQESGDDQEQLRANWAMQMPESGESTELMKLYGLDATTLARMKDIIELGTDNVLEKIQGDQAVMYLAMQDFRAGTLKVDEKSLEVEYGFQKESFKKLEWLRFAAIRVPSVEEGALTHAARVHERIELGETFDEIFAEYVRIYPKYVIESEIENNPSLARFRGFWVTASGAQPGDIIGPVYLPDYQQVAVDNQGQQRTVQMPDAYLVLKVLESRPETTMTLEEAMPQLLPPLLFDAEMLKLREEHGVEVYEDKLPDPQGSAADFDALFD
jgi:hypothetical protein